MSNLPPGVTDLMIPGNRPEDIEYEKFWEEVTNKARKLGIDTEWIPELHPLQIELIDWIYEKGHKDGYRTALSDAAMEAAYLNQPIDFNEGGDD